MEAQVWTLIALMFTALVGLFFFVATRFDSLNGRLDSRFDSITGRLDEQSLLVHELKAQSTLHAEALERLDGRVERLDGRVDNLEGEVRALGRSLGEQIYSVAKKLDEHLRRHAS